MNTPAALMPLASPLRTRARLSPVPCLAGRLAPALCGFALLVLLAFAPARLAAQAAGTIEGRVKNAVTGEYLEKARISIAGTPRVTFTDATGSYLLTNVPAGTVTLRVFFTGLDEQEIAVQVGAGGPVQRDVELTSKARYGEGEAIKLDQIVVHTTRETNAAAIAINEQRFARNITSVVSTDAFGEISENNLGEFVKWLPGVGVEYFANDITGINVRGFGSVNTEITFNGLPSATAYTESNSRAFEMRQSSTADISRVEVRKVPLPSDSSNAIGGSVNLIRKSAFEQSRRRIDYSVSLNAGDEDGLTWSRTPGVGDRRQRDWRPNWRVSITDPVTKTFGYSFNIAHSDVIAPQHWSQPNWNYGLDTRTTGNSGRSLGNPQMQQPLLHDGPIQTVRDSYSLTLDWRPVPQLTLSANMSYFDSERTTRDTIRYQWNNGGNPVRVTPNETLGQPDGGSAFHNSPLWRDDKSPKTDASLTARWRADKWVFDGAVAASFAKHQFMDTKNGFFGSSTFDLADIAGSGANNPEGTTLVRNPTNGSVSAANALASNHAGIYNITLNFHDQTGFAPQRIEALRGGTPVDWASADNVTLRGARARDTETKTELYALKLKAKRTFSTTIPLSLEAGYDYTFEFRDRTRWTNETWVFVGRDGIAQTDDDSAAPIRMDNFPPERDNEYNYPAIEKLSMEKYYQLYKQHPEYFAYQHGQSYRGAATNPMHIAEETQGAYLMGDASLFRGRLNLVGGVRLERTAAEGRGFLQTTASYARYTGGTLITGFGTAAQESQPAAGQIMYTNDRTVDGNIVRGTAANPNTWGRVRRITDPATGQEMEPGGYAESVLNYHRKGSYGRGRKDNIFPSLHLTYNVSQNFQIRAAYAKTQAKVRFDRSVIPNTTIRQPQSDDDNPNSAGFIEGRNPGLEPWVADNFDVRLEYYTPQGGTFAVGGFVKNIDDFQVQRTHLFLNGIAYYVGENSAQLQQASPESLGVSSEYLQEYNLYSYRTWVNTGSARISGFELEARQRLDAFVPGWARGFDVLASFNTADLDGIATTSGDFGSLNKQRGTLWLNYSRDRLKVGVGFIYNGEIFQQTENLGGEAGYRELQPRKMIDLTASFRVHRRANLFFSVRNLTGESNLSIRETPNMAPWAKVRSDNAHGANYTLGLNGSW